MLDLPAQMCRDLAKASQREWLETNGLGGFASSTITGLNTRRYHGLLCAALAPPSKRFLLLSKLEESLVVDGTRYDLSVNTYPGTVHPAGHEFQTSFRLDAAERAPFPTFTWQVEDVELTKQVFLVHGSNTVVVEYVLRVPEPAAKHDVKLEIRPLLAFRGYHELAHRNDSFRTSYIESDAHLAIAPYDGLPALHFNHDAVEVEKSGHWYYNFEYQRERERGLDFVEDLFQPFVLHFDLNARPQAAIIASLSPHDIASVPDLHQAEIARRKSVGGKLAAAADQFIVKRGAGHSIIAGYPWFGDWGRDTMISLPGLTLCTARSALAKEILEEFAKWIQDGMLPNTFPDHGEQPQYNSVDSALWYFEAVRAYADLTHDYDWIFRRIYGPLGEIVDAYIRGTRYNVRLDADGLVHAGESGVALTWMDARLNGVPVTPRAGKPVEIQALWYNALRIMESFAARQDSGRKDFYASLAESTRAAFQSKFWNGSENCLFDVIEVDGADPDHKNDASIRPNQVFAASLTHKLLEPVAARQVLDVVERELLTPFGLRTLSPKDPQYRGTYAGDVAARDYAYHQGTVWPWLMGPFVVAWFAAHGGDSAARQRSLNWLSALREYRTSEGMNQLPEVFDGDPPHRPGGCPAQAWSLATVIQSFLTVY
jgi:predicted glycogen debranching enzyme